MLLYKILLNQYHYKFNGLKVDDDDGDAISLDIKFSKNQGVDQQLQLTTLLKYQQKFSRYYFIAFIFTLPNEILL
jgi:hypothetical protein